MLDPFGRIGFLILNITLSNIVKTVADICFPCNWFVSELD